MRDVIQNWQGTDADLLAALNLKQFKRKIGDGMVTLAMIGDLGVSVAAGLSLTLDSVIAQLPTGTQEEQATKSMLQKFSDRLTVSDRGLDFHNDTVRGQFTQILLGAGWQQAAIDAVLGLGAVYESYADRALSREALQSDVDAVRRSLWNKRMQSRGIDAAALFASRAEQAASEWDESEQAAQWASAWGDMG